ncbi:hypothetical protein [Cellulomonas sp. URHB0016]
MSQEPGAAAHPASEQPAVPLDAALGAERRLVPTAGLTDGPDPDGRRHAQRLELIATVLLAAATVMTAWSAFQSSTWGSLATSSYSAASADRTLSNRAATTAGQQTIIDVTLFTDWLAAVDDEQGHVALAGYVPDPALYSGFLYERFRPEFRPAVHAWLTLEPGSDPAAPPSPFVMDEYVLAEAEESHRLERSADVSASRAQRASERKDDYVLATVMCASVLFFTGIGTKLSSRRTRTTMVVSGGVVLLATAAVLLASPVRFG